MKRRAISILAVLALLCTMFTFAMPTTAETAALAETYPNYADHVTATENGHDGKNWSISTAADWLAMIETANTTSDVEYFKDVTFHLTGDVDFKETEWLLPMGAGKYFSGTINGNGYGFNDFKIYENTGEATTGECATGMFYRLGNCHFVDFGINSGTIIRAKDNALSSVTTFGGVANGYAPTFTRVWSGAMLSHTSSGTVSALAAPATIIKEKDSSKDDDGEGTKADNYIEPFVVNGFVFDGQILNEGKNAFSILGTYPSMTVSSGVKAGRSVCSVYSLTNVITDAQLYLTGSGSPSKPTSTTATGVYKPTGLTPAAVGPAVEYSEGRYSMLFSSNSTSTIKKSTFENLYTVEYPNTTAYLGRSDTRTADPTMMAKSALEAAWTINNKPSEKADEVYFTLKNGKIRPTAKADKKIVKVTLTGDREKVYYLNANTTYDNLGEVLEKKDQHEFEVSQGTAILQNGQLQLKDGDVTINVTINCDHPVDKVRYEPTENAHIKTCAACDFYKEIPCSAEKESDYTIDPIAGEDLAAVEKATHSGTCQFCKEDFTLECTVSYVPSTEYNQEAYWKFSDCVCGRGNIEHAGSAKVLCGDVTGDSEVNLMDAVLILRESVGLGEIDKVRNADVNGDYVHNMDDVILTVRRWLGNKDAKDIALQTESRINENLFNSEAVTKGNLTMDGTEGDVEGYVVSDPIAVHPGEKLSFGPVRLSAPVMGYFYDAEGNPLQLINHTNAKVGYTFEEGKALVSIDVPAGAASVRFQMATEEIDQFYLRVNAEITGMDYEKRFAIESSAIDNPLKGRTFLTVGDSLCAAANDAYVGNEEIGYVKGWARRIRDNFGAKVTNSAEGGASLSTAAYDKAVEEGVEDKKSPSPDQYIINQMLQHNGTKNFDYILLEGGVNDSNTSLDAPIGTISDSFDPADFDKETTMAGGLERTIYNAIKEHGDTAAFGYLALYQMPSKSFSNYKGHLEMAKLICKKWGIPYVDFYNNPPEGFDAASGAHTSDGCHAIAEGYDLMQPQIDAFVPTMRPISQEIYNKVHEVGERPEAKEDGGPLYTAEENPYKDSLKILAIGNSFSADATKYLWGIADSYGTKNVVIGNLHIGGCSLDTHWDNIVNEQEKAANKELYSYYKWTAEDHVTKPNTAISTALADEDWDFITLQQASDQNLVFDTEGNPYDPSGNPVDTYSKLDEIIAYLQENEPNAKILWHMTWAYATNSTKKAFAAYENDQMEMYNSLLDRAQDLMDMHEAFEGVLPSGTAIQNLRDCSTTGNGGPSATGEPANNKGYGYDTINRDGYHLNYGVGRYTAALTWYCYITGADPREVTFLPNNEYRTSIALRQYEIGQSVLDAIQNPYNK